MPNAVEQYLLLPIDMVDLRSMRKHEVFLFSFLFFLFFL